LYYNFKNNGGTKLFKLSTKIWRLIKVGNPHATGMPPALCNNLLSSGL
jgi:hypothetical protein